MFSEDSISGCIIAEERFMQVTLRNIIGAYSENHELKPVHLHVLGMLAFEDGQTLKQLQERTHMRPSNLSPICTVLEKRQLIRRERDESDGRASHLFLTQRGSDMLAGLDEWMNRVFSCAGCENDRLHEEIRKGFQAFRTLVETARERGDEA